MISKPSALSAAACLTAVGLASAVYANPIDIRFDGIGSGRNVNVTSPTTNRDLFAGQMKHSFKNANPAVFGTAVGSFTSYCADISQFASSSYKTFNVTGSTAMPFPGGQASAKGAALDGIFAWRGLAAISAGASSDFAAAFQLAVWEIQHDYNPSAGLASLSLSAGNFRAAGTGGGMLSSGIATEFSTLIGHIHDALSGSQTVVGVASTSYQDQLTIIPAPGAIAVGALGGLLMARRRRRGVDPVSKR